MRFPLRLLMLSSLLAALVVAMSGCVPPSLRIPLGVNKLPWTLAFMDADHRLKLIDSDGQRQLFDQQLAEKGAAASPTGVHVAAVTATGELWIVETLLGVPVKIADGPVATSFWPEASPWSADGRALVYVISGNVFYQRLGRKAHQLTTTGDAFTASLSPDGKRVAYGRKDKLNKDLGLWVAGVRGHGEPKQIVQSNGDIFSACCPHWSPDGRWIAFLQAYEGGALGVAKADGTDTRVGVEAAWEPLHWLPDSSTLLFPRVPYGESPDGLWSYSVSAKKAQPLAEPGQEVAYALSPDGSQALVAAGKLQETTPPTQATVGVLSLPDGAPQAGQRIVKGEPLEAAWSPRGDLGLLCFSPERGTVLISHNGLKSFKNLAVASKVAGWVHCQ